MRRRRLLRFGALAVVGVMAIVFIVALFLPSLPISFKGSGPTGDAGLRMPDQGARHINEGQEHAPYNSLPATSGWHYGPPLAPMRPGVYDTPIPNEQLLHNLEHGGVGVHYNCPDGCDDLVEQLSAIVGGVTEIVMSPFPGMDTRIALTGWTYIDKFDEFDEERVRTFIDDHLNSPVAPEYTARGGTQMNPVDDGG